MTEKQQKTKELSPKRARFVEEYLVDLNATQAAIRAGYSEKTAYSQAERLLRNVEVKAAIEKASEERSKKVGLSQEYVVKNLLEIVERSMQRAPVLTMKGEQVQDDQGRDVWQFDAKNANKALELLGKHLGMYRDKTEHDVEMKVISTWEGPEE